MPRNPIGERAMTGTERSRKRLEREAARLAAIEGAVKDATNKLLEVGRMIGGMGYGQTAQECFRVVEKALGALAETPDGPSVLDKPEGIHGGQEESDDERKQRLYEEGMRERRSMIHASYHPDVYMKQNKVNVSE